MKHKWTKERRARYVVLWIFGRINEVPHPDAPYVIKVTPGKYWEYAPTGDFFDFTIHTIKAPCFIYRWTQRICFGVKYKLIKDNI